MKHLFQKFYIRPIYFIISILCVGQYTHIISRERERVREIERKRECEREKEREKRERREREERERY